MLNKKELKRLGVLKTIEELSTEEKAELATLLEKEQEAASEESENESPDLSFDKEGASHVVTMRDSKAVTVWFKNGKEIGVENAG
jgi:hypothetical protein